MKGPQLLRGIEQIAAHLGMGARQAEHLRRSGLLPTFRIPHDSAPHATAAALDDWKALAPIPAARG